ncbi:MAG TPA: hypothetical protein VGR08_11230, partial [Thermomicrobiales bacterium]|nr:hypothetical protein [Thermomicrobiales bacterium]
PGNGAPLSTMVRVERASPSAVYRPREQNPQPLPDPAQTVLLTHALTGFRVRLPSAACLEIRPVDMPLVVSDRYQRANHACHTASGCSWM